MRTPIHPGIILGDEIEGMNITAAKLAEAIGVPANRLYQIIAGKRDITADTSLRLGKYFGMSDQFWLNLQKIYDLDCARLEIGPALKSIKPRSHTTPAHA